MRAVTVVAVIIGLVFIALAALYWLTPAGSLPAFLPGFKEGSASVHVKHAVGSLVIGLILLVAAWFAGSRRSV
jgi:hypothetical protein